MPVRSRSLMENVKHLTNRRAELETELETATSELEPLQTSVMIGSAKTESLVNQQIKVNTIRQTIDRIDFEIAEVNSQIAAERQAELRKQVISRIIEIDREAESAGKAFVLIYSDIKNLSYPRFVEMAKLRFQLMELKQSFHVQIMRLFPSVQSLMDRHLPELQSALDELLEELQGNGCFLNVLRSNVFSSFSAPYQEAGRFTLPENPLQDWVLLSMERIENFEKKNGSLD